MTDAYYSQFVGVQGLFKWHLLADELVAVVAKPGDKLAEFGAGSGSFLRHLIDRYGIQGIGFDYSEVSIEQIRTLGIAALRTDFSESLVGVANEAFDIAVSCEVIEHLTNPRRFVREIRRVLKNRGHLVLTTPNAFNIMRRVNYLFGEHRDPLMDVSRVPYVEHIHGLNFGMLVRLLTQEGFWIKRMIGDRVPRCQGWVFQRARNLFSSEACVLAQKSDGTK